MRPLSVIILELAVLAREPVLAKTELESLRLMKHPRATLGADIFYIQVESTQSAVEFI